jgi:hypothetical protein
MAIKLARIQIVLPATDAVLIKKTAKRAGKATSRWIRDAIKKVLAVT